jgi:hypothetical protein
MLEQDLQICFGKIELSPLALAFGYLKKCFPYLVLNTFTLPNINVSDHINTCGEEYIMLILI